MYRTWPVLWGFTHKELRICHGRGGRRKLVVQNGHLRNRSLLCIIALENHKNTAETPWRDLRTARAFGPIRETHKAERRSPCDTEDGRMPTRRGAYPEGCLPRSGREVLKTRQLDRVLACARCTLLVVSAYARLRPLTPVYARLCPSLPPARRPVRCPCAARSCPPASSYSPSGRTQTTKHHGET